MSDDINDIHVKDLYPSCPCEACFDRLTKDYMMIFGGMKLNFLPSLDELYKRVSDHPY
jgi:hypothetical protein